MPLNGNRMGSRSKYLYQSDDDNIYYILTTDDDLAVAGFGDVSDPPEIYDPQNPPATGTICPAPRRFKPRRVHLKDPISGAQKSPVAFYPDATAYSRSIGEQITIDGLAFTSTGRTGESLTF